MRTRLCGSLRLGDVGATVTVCGWVAHRREHGEHLAFLDLRDHTGIVQCVIPGTVDARSEFVVAVSGVVRPRPEGTANPDLATGEIEIGDCTVTVLNRAEPPPFPVDDRAEVDEVTRLSYRYVDLRRPRMQANLRTRATVNRALRAAMDRQGFVEVETPLLWAPTPEGAREFAVPSRLNPGSGYVLPQSPQLAKQLLMVAGVDRYYQIARCLRDEDLRADRQFEFTQLDLEASFVGQDDVLGFVSEAVLDAAEAVTGERPGAVPHMTWAEALDRYGTDKPDLRFGMELVDLSPVFETTAVKAFAAPCVKALVVPRAGPPLAGRGSTASPTGPRQLGAKGLAWFRVTGDRGGPDGPSPGLDSPLDRFLSDEERAGLLAATAAAPGDLVLAVADEHRTACDGARAAPGRARGAAGERGPLPLRVGGRLPPVRRRRRGRPPGRRPPSLHHAPCRRPRPARVGPGLGPLAGLRPRPQRLGARVGQRADPPRATSSSGCSPPSASDEETARARFGFLLGAFRYGAPPHAGFAVGIDRLAAIFAGEDSIREVIAFPKTQSGSDPMTGAPEPIAGAVLAELGLGLRSAPPAG